MPSQKASISFGPNQQSSYDELGGSSSSAINVVIDKNGVVYKRPGITEYSVAPSSVVDSNGVIGVYSTNDGQLFAVGGLNLDRAIYKIANGNKTDLSSPPASNLVGGNRPVFTETEAFLVIAGGRELQKVNLSTLASSRLGGDPPLATFVTANSSRLIANDATVDKTKVRFSGIAQGTVVTTGHETWGVGNDDDGGFFTAEARPDNVVAVIENTNEVFVWGTDNVQIFVPDTTSIFAPAATREFGTSAPYSIIKRDQEFFWLDQYRRFVYSDGRTFKTIEEPIKKKLDTLSTISDCFGYRVFLGHIDCFVWTFPTDGVTFAYQKDGGWSEWHGWDSSQSNFKLFQVKSHHIRRDGGINVVGTIDGHVAKLSQSASSDLGDLIVSRVNSGFLNRETENLKFCRSVKITARRGENSSEPIGRLEWRDDTGNYGNPLFFDFGSTGDNYVTKEFRSLGAYRRRYWRFTFSDSANLALVKVEEEFDVLGV
jgi:hypothetical protein